MRNKEIHVSDLSNETFIALYLSELYAFRYLAKEPFPEVLNEQLLLRGKNYIATNPSAFDIENISPEEMLERVKRVHLNLAILNGLQLPIANRFGIDEYHNHDLIQDGFFKILERLSDDEIAELAAMIESNSISFAPAQKEILIEVYERSNSKNDWV